MKLLLPFVLVVAAAAALSAAEKSATFEGKIDIVTTQGNETTALLYTVGENYLRIEVTGSNWPHPIDIVDLKSGTVTLVFPHNRSFVRLTSGSGKVVAQPPGKPEFATPPSGIGPQSQPNPAVAGPSVAPPIPTPPGGLPPGIGPQSSPGSGAPVMPPMPVMPMMPPMMSEKIELKPTGKKEKMLGFACEQFEIKARGETMEIWATAQLFPYQPYIRRQPHRFGPRMIEEQWQELLTAKKMFPLRVSLSFEKGPERFRFEVKSVTPEKISDKDGKLFQPPEGYTEIQPLPF
jgi:hypothetical protein